MTVTSPCTGVCKLDEVTGWCFGCGRSGDEIVDWRAETAAVREQIWAQIPDRLQQLGVTCRRLPWTTEEIRSFVTSTLSEGRGTWVMGVVGAVAEFTAARDEMVEVSSDGDDITATTRNGAIRVTIDDDVRALTFDPAGSSAAPRVVLGVKRSRGRPTVAQGVAHLGPDAQALLEGRDLPLYDLGLARKEGAFCVRTGPGPAQQALDDASGMPLMQALPLIAGPLIAQSPTRVVQSALGRIEVQGQIPPPDAQSPDGPHTHLLPDHLKTGRSMPIGMDLPRAYLPGAIFYPPR